MWWTWLIVAPFLVLALYAAWASAHELSHVAAARLAGPLKSWSASIWPARGPDGAWTFARSGWEWEKVPSLPTVGWVLLAPRIPNMIAAAALPFGAQLPEAWQVAAWASLWGAGLVDLGVGSVGASPRSDLRRAAVALGVSPWTFRVAGFALLAASVGAWAALLVLRWA